MDPQAPETRSAGPQYQPPMPAPQYTGGGAPAGQPDIIKRGIATFIDFFAIGCVYMFLSLALGIPMGWMGRLIAAAAATVLALGRDVLFQGTSPGKKVLGLAVVKADGSPITVQESVRRNSTLALSYALNIVAAVPVLGLLAIPLYLVAGAAWIYEIYLVATNQPRLGDKLAGGTHVIFQGKPAVAF
jgi:uncharacterized RDD family membrane protein YckC